MYTLYRPSLLPPNLPSNLLLLNLLTLYFRSFKHTRTFVSSVPDSYYSFLRHSFSLLLSYKTLITVFCDNLIPYFFLLRLLLFPFCNNLIPYFFLLRLLLFPFCDNLIPYFFLFKFVLFPFCDILIPSFKTLVTSFLRQSYYFLSPCSDLELKVSFLSVYVFSCSVHETIIFFLQTLRTRVVSCLLLYRVSEYLVVNYTNAN